MLEKKKNSADNSAKIITIFKTIRAKKKKNIKLGYINKKTNLYNFFEISKYRYNICIRFLNYPHEYPAFSRGFTS